MSSERDAVVERLTNVVAQMQDEAQRHRVAMKRLETQYWEGLRALHGFDNLEGAKAINAGRIATVLRASQWASQEVLDAITDFIRGASGRLGAN